MSLVCEGKKSERETLELLKLAKQLPSFYKPSEREGEGKEEIQKHRGTGARDF